MLGFVVAVVAVAIVVLFVFILFFKGQNARLLPLWVFVFGYDRS